MSVMSRTTNFWLALSQTISRLRFEGADVRNCGAGRTAEHEPSMRAPLAVVTRVPDAAAPGLLAGWWTGPHETAINPMTARFRTKPARNIVLKR
jgi:hypothetical protein